MNIISVRGPTVDARFSPMRCVESRRGWRHSFQSGFQGSAPMPKSLLEVLFFPLICTRTQTCTFVPADAECTTHDAQIAHCLLIRDTRRRVFRSHAERSHGWLKGSAVQNLQVSEGLDSCFRAPNPGNGNFGHETIPKLHPIYINEMFYHWRTGHETSGHRGPAQTFYLWKKSPTTKEDVRVQVKAPGKVNEYFQVLSGV